MDRSFTDTAMAYSAIAESPPLNRAVLSVSQVLIAELDEREDD